VKSSSDRLQMTILCHEIYVLDRSEIYSSCLGKGICVRLRLIVWIIAAVRGCCLRASLNTYNIILGVV